MCRGDRRKQGRGTDSQEDEGGGAGLQHLRRPRERCHKGSSRIGSRHLAPSSDCSPLASSHKLSMTDLVHGVTVTTHDLRAASIILRVFRAKSGNLVAAALDRRWRRVVGCRLPSTGRWRLKPRRATGGRLRPRPVGWRGGRKRNRLGIFAPPIGAGCWLSCCLPAFWVDGRRRNCGRAPATVRRRDR